MSNIIVDFLNFGSIILNLFSGILILYKALKIQKRSNRASYFLISTILIIAGLSFIPIIHFFGEEYKVLSSTITLCGVFLLAIIFHEDDKRLFQTEKMYQILIENMNEALTLENADGILTYINPKYTSMTGYTKDDVIGKHWSIDVPDEDIKIYNIEADKRRKGISSTYEATVKTKDGFNVPVIVTAGPIFTKNGEFNGVICSFTDITERKRAEEELIKTKTRLEYLVTSSPAIIFSCEPTAELKVKFMSKNIKEILGYEPHEFVKNNLWTDLIHAQDRERTVKAFNRTLETGYYSESYRFKHKNGTYRWMFEEAKLYFDINQKPLEIIGFWTDITNQKETEEDLIKAKEKYQMLIEKMEEGVLLEDAKGLITFLNPKLYKLLNYTEEEIIGKHWTVTAPESYLEECKAQSSKRPEGIGSTYESGLLTKDGSIIPINITASPLFSQDGEFEGVLSVFTDITKQKQIEEDLIEAKEKYQMLIEKMEEGVFLEDADGYITFLNPKLYKLLGYTEEEIIGKHWTFTTPKSDIEKGMAESAKRPKGIGSTYESGLLTKDGSIIPVSISASPLFSQSGEYEGVLSVITDITMQKQTESALIEAKNKYQMLIEKMEEGVLLEDENGNIAFANQKFLNLTGYREKDLYGKHWSNFTPLKSHNYIRSESEKRPKGISSTYETEILGKDGRIIPIINTASPLFSQSGEYEGVLSVITDITIQKQTESALIEAKNKYQMLIEKMEEGVFLEDAKGLISFINPKALEMLGYKEDELIGKHWSVTASPKHLAMTKVESSKRPEGVTSSYESALKAKDGSIIPIIVSASPLFSQDSEYEGVLSVFTNITELKKEERKTAAIVNSISDGILVLDHGGKVYMANEQFKEYYREIILHEMPQNWNCTLSSGNIFYDTIKQVYLGKKPYARIIEPIKGLHLQISSQIQLNPDYITIGGILEVRDVTSFVEFDNLRKRFVSTVSHELRTPISVIVQSIDNMIHFRDRITEFQRTRLVQAISRNADLLTELIEDLLLFSRIDEKRIRFKWEECNAVSIINDIIIQMKLQFKAKNITTIIDVEENTIFYGDKSRIAQIIRNLLDNAQKYSPFDSKITVKVIGHYQGIYNPKSKDGILIQVIDNGLGIHKKDLTHMFERFYRSDEVKKIPGTGLGLAIAKELVMLHQGDIYVESKYGEGSTFSVFLPCLSKGAMNKLSK